MAAIVVGILLGIDNARALPVSARRLSSRTNPYGAEGSGQGGCEGTMIEKAIRRIERSLKHKNLLCYINYTKKKIV